MIRRLLSRLLNHRVCRPLPLLLLLLRFPRVVGAPALASVETAFALGGALPVVAAFLLVLALVLTCRAPLFLVLFLLLLRLFPLLTPFLSSVLLLFFMSLKPSDLFGLECWVQLCRTFTLTLLNLIHG